MYERGNAVTIFTYSIWYIVGEALVSYQGIALAMPQFIEIRRPFRGWNGADLSPGRYNREI